MNAGGRGSTAQNGEAGKNPRLMGKEMSLPVLQPRKPMSKQQARSPSQGNYGVAPNHLVNR